MLVLSRKRYEDVCIEVPPSDRPTFIRMSVVELRGDKARLGFEAPRSVAVHRNEVYDAIKRKEAAEGGAA